MITNSLNTMGPGLKYFYRVAVLVTYKDPTRPKWEDIDFIGGPLPDLRAKAIEHHRKIQGEIKDGKAYYGQLSEAGQLLLPMGEARGKVLEARLYLILATGPGKQCPFLIIGNDDPGNLIEAIAIEKQIFRELGLRRPG